MKELESSSKQTPVEESSPQTVVNLLPQVQKKSRPFSEKHIYQTKRRNLRASIHIPHPLSTGNLPYRAALKLLLSPTMGSVFGKIGVETPKFEVLKTTPDYDVRKYSPSIVAEVTYAPSQVGGSKDGGFRILANYIGALGNPQNKKPERIAMTAPVITQNPENPSEKIAKTAPVITQNPENPSEKIAMTAPVITQNTEKSDGSEENRKQEKMVTMQFVLPAKYTTVEETPVPIDERVVLREVGERKYGVVRFSGVATDEVVGERVEKLRQSLERDGYRVTGKFLLARYNPPWTLPIFRTNEIMLPVG